MISIDDFLLRFDEEPGYLDFARVGPLSRASIEEERALDELLSRARFGSLESLMDQNSRFQSAAGKLTGFKPEQIVFQPNTSIGLMQVAFGLKGKVLISPAEFPSGPFALVRAAAAMGEVEPQWLETDFAGVTASAIKKQLDKDTVAVALSLVDFRTGRLADLESIREVIGDRLLIVDGIQGFTAVDVDYRLVDILATGGQKWARAGWGTGLLALSDRALEAVQPVLSGFNATDVLPMPMDSVPDPAKGAKAFQQSNPSPIAQARFAAAMEEIAEVGVGAIAARVLENSAKLIELADEFGIRVVSPRDDRQRAGIVSLEPEPAEFTALVASLHNHGVTATSRGSSIRLSAHATTSGETVGMLRAALESFTLTARR